MWDPPDQGWNLCLLHWQADSLPLSHQGSPICISLKVQRNIPRWLSGEESICNVQNVGLISGLGRSPGEGHGNPLQCSCLGNPMDRVDWQSIVHGVTRVRHNLATTLKVHFALTFIPLIITIGFCFVFSFLH